MAVTLSALIDDVEQRAPSKEPLDLLATASATVAELSDLTDALLSHFVDECRRAGHSWAEIGLSLGVTKQAVQKRFTSEQRQEPPGWEQWTPRAKRAASELAGAASEQLGHNFVGTEHLLIALTEGGGVAAAALGQVGVTRDAVIDAVVARVPRDAQGRGGFTPRAWVAMSGCMQHALALGHNYVGTEHLLLSLLGGGGGVAAEVLTELKVDYAAVQRKVVALLEGGKQK